MQSLTRAQVREVDRRAIEDLGIPGVVLMENAGRGAAEAIVRLLRERGIDPAGARIGVLCGGGNNGGDGYVVARHLTLVGARVTIYPAVALERLKGDARINAETAAKMGLRHETIDGGAAVDRAGAAWDGCAALVDALLGTGFGGAVRPPLDAAIARCNAARARPRGPAVVALDVPSGLDCDTGETATPTVVADLTVTFVAPKVGFSRGAAAAYLGRVEVVGIGAPAAAPRDAPPRVIQD